MVAQRRDARREHDAHAQPHAYSVREQELPVHLRDARHEHAEDVERSARDDQVFQVPRIEERAGDAAQQGGQAQLDRPDPRNLRGRRGGELVVRVVVLEDAELM